MVSLGVMDAKGSRSQSSSRAGKAGGGSQGCARDFEQNLRRLWQRAPHGHQGTPRADVESGGELKEFLAFFIPAANKHRDRQWQARPLPTFFFGSASNQG
jgi:hypothetical protein